MTQDDQGSGTRMNEDVRITVAHIARHTPPNAGAQGRDAAIIDIAQDLLLRHLHGVGVLDALAFKGGTSLRKLYAGNQGRFSLDLDFSGVSIGVDPDDALTDLIASIDALTIGPFRYGVVERRGKWTLTYEHSFGGDTGSRQSKLNLPLLRRLAVLKIWMDANGAHVGDSHWKPGHEGPPFEPDHWLRDRSDKEFDAEDIGALAVPTPTARELSEALCTRFQFLADLDDDERIVALAREQDRPLVLRLLTELPGGRLTGKGLY